MQLTYRGIHYTRSTEVEAPKTVRLTYRGVTIDRARDLACPAVPETERPFLLIYRGVTYIRPATPVVPYQKPRAIRWLYRFI